MSWLVIPVVVFVVVMALCAMASLIDDEDRQ
jgi:hypothetical protein